MSKVQRQVWAAVFMIVGVVLLGLTFEFRFMWFIQGLDVWILRGGLVFGTFVLASLWIWYPSLSMSAIVVLLTATFPWWLGIDRGSSSATFWISVVFAILLADVAMLLRKVRFQHRTISPP